VPAAAAGPPVGAGAQSAGPDHPAPPAPMRQTPGMGVAVRRVLTGEEARTLSGADGRFAPATPAPPRRAHASAPSAGQEPRLPRPGAAPATVAFGWDAPSRPAGPLSLSAEQLQSRLPSANSGRAAPDAAATSPRQPSLPEGGDPSRMSAVSRMRASIQVRPVPDGAIGDAQISPPPKRGDMQSLVARVVDRQTGPRPAPSPAAASVPLAASPGPQGDGTRAAVSVRPALAALSAPAQAGQDLSGPAGTRGVGAAAGAGMPGQLAAEHAVPGDPPTRHPLVSASSGVVAGQSAAAAQAGAPTLDAAEPMPVPEQRAPVAPAAHPSGDLAEGALRAGSSPVGGGQAPGQSGVASSAAQTSAASASAASSGAEAARAVLPQVAAAIRAVPGSASFDLQLDPPELGRVRIGLDITDSGLRASLMAERPATGELLRANGAVLAQQLQDAGFSEIDLDFGAPQQDRRDTREREMARSRGAASGSAVSADASSAYAASAIGEEGIDLRF